MKFERFAGPTGSQVDFHLSMSKAFIESTKSKLLLALPPGAQDEADASAYESWLPSLKAAGWATLIPLAPKGKSFFHGSETKIPALLDYVLGQLETKKENTFALFGASNGGISAFRVGTLFPERFHSITVMPGWPKPADEARLEKVLHLPITFIVGEKDDRWLRKSELFVNRINQMGGKASLEIIPNEDHYVVLRYPISKLIETLRKK
jgi:surfactin synthase thioesterase subunit